MAQVIDTREALDALPVAAAMTDDEGYFVVKMTQEFYWVIPPADVQIVPGEERGYLYDVGEIAGDCDDESPFFPLTIDDERN